MQYKVIYNMMIICNLMHSSVPLDYIFIILLFTAYVGCAGDVNFITLTYIF
jgi:type IV secretory pathway VirB3-like protein